LKSISAILAVPDVGILGFILRLAIRSGKLGGNPLSEGADRVTLSAGTGEYEMVAHIANVH
jgi:hypothetical protein